MKQVNILLIWFLVFAKIIYSIETPDIRKMSVLSDAPINATIIRHKRYLDFVPKTRMCLRANMKVNVLSASQLIAFAFGYRANFPIENNKRIKRRDVYDSMEEIMDYHGFDGRACISKLLCDATSNISPGSGMFSRLFQLIFRLPQAGDELYNSFDADQCEKYSAECPLRLSNLTPYTDL